jgi:DNA (cytosine-5)-methyltransferase 1
MEVEGAAKREMFERTRATALDIIAAVDVRRFDAVLCETVLEFAA